MSKVRLEKMFTGGGAYSTCQNRILILLHRGEWVISCMMAPEDWMERNREINEVSFPRLAEVRKYLEALLALDPLPAPPGHAAPRSLRRRGPGRYAIVEANEVLIELHRDGGYWKLYRNGDLFADYSYPSLSRVRSIWGIS